MREDKEIEFEAADNTRCKHYLGSRTSPNLIYKEMGCYECTGLDRECPNLHQLSKGLEFDL